MFARTIDGPQTVARVQGGEMADSAVVSASDGTPARKKGFRKFTWVILAINVIFLVWLIAGFATANNSPCGGGLSTSACQAASDIGTGIGAMIVVFLWVAADIILGIIWLITRPRQR